LREDSHLNALIKTHGIKKAATTLIKKARKHFENMAFEFGLELVGPTVAHLDEIGQMHFHQISTNFDEHGESINLRQNKHGRGSYVQDMVAEEFQSLGFVRGITAKERRANGETPKHIPNREYQIQKADEENAIKIKTEEKFEAKKALKAVNRKIVKANNAITKLTPLNKIATLWHKRKLAQTEVKLEVAEAEKLALEEKIIKLELDAITATTSLEAKDTELSEALETQKEELAKDYIQILKKDRQTIHDYNDEHKVKPLKKDKKNLENLIIDLNETIEEKSTRIVKLVSENNDYRKRHGRNDTPTPDTNLLNIK